MTSGGFLGSGVPPRRGEWSDARRPFDRPVRQDPAARGRPRHGCGVPRPSRRSPSWSARPSTSTPTGSRRSGCGTRALPATTPSRSSTPCSSTPATPCRMRCWSTSPRRWPGTAGCSCTATPPTGWCCARSTVPVLDRGAAVQEASQRCWARGSTQTPSPFTPSERGHLKQVLLKLGWPAEDLAGYVDGEAHAIELDEDGW